MSAVDLHAKPSATYETKLATTRNLLREAADAHARTPGNPAVTQANSLGAEDVVIGHLIDAMQLDIPAFVLDTGMLHPETLELLERLRAGSSRNIQALHPQQEAVVHFVKREGADAMYRSIELRKACCDIRKMEPLERALQGKDAWITGLRREQSGARAEVPLVDRGTPGRIKYNPLAEWTWGDVWHYISQHRVPYNPLHDQFFPSIGCAPCTRAISLGEDFRAGRWWWEEASAKECGLHVADASAPVSALAETTLPVSSLPVSSLPLSSNPAPEAARSTV
jgi:phosphoadenosine phosphosulfate reductase